MIKNIIFDLGDVIINIDVPRAARSFAELSNQTPEDVHLLIHQNEVFKKFETGHLTPLAFRSLIREVFKTPEWTDDVIDASWNSLLLDIPPDRIKKIQELSQKGYRLFLLSNTSSIHIDEVNAILFRTFEIEHLGHLFEKLFLSYEMGVMKPSPDIYKNVLESAGIDADETLFLDDNLDNIRAAAKCGIHTIHVQKPLSIVDYLRDY
ncbi:HAD family hydrolase [Runella slithyformis]|uniref:HAD-superfamily hydrolase, subfamily IA, variant 3 n=1 Tax=Runella slithyformis (strain ATCC 29530 / DSM 19594 / LMG 11500 / NCIMB 11436 / LSU 4) TaxID=761193 RepID=A0A7U3ZPE4_RUNSL|nr:HAD family phosphatase [Runella slithyformis]AEI50873.1 HAD-superfamily hydrolase, subfamily IA, variant 3 [Runella slithyformis DSM 19594]